MPVYQYKCSCGNSFEELVSASKRDSVLCSCGKTASRIIDFQSVDLYLKGEWRDKNVKEKRFRSHRASMLEKKQEDLI